MGGGWGLQGSSKSNSKRMEEKTFPEGVRGSLASEPPDVAIHWQRHGKDDLTLAGDIHDKNPSLVALGKNGHLTCLLVLSL